MFPETGLSQPTGRASRELRWGCDGASLKSASAFFVDPIGRANFYEYGNDFPVSATDPMGREVVRTLLGRKSGINGEAWTGWGFSIGPRMPEDVPYAIVQNLPGNRVVNCDRASPITSNYCVRMSMQQIGSPQGSDWVTCNDVCEDNYAGFGTTPYTWDLS